MYDRLYISAFRDVLQHMWDRREEYDEVVPAHEILYLGKTYIRDMLYTCNAVIDAPEKYDLKTIDPEKGTEIMWRAIGTGSIRYSENSIK